MSRSAPPRSASPSTPRPPPRPASPSTPPATAATPAATASPTPPPRPLRHRRGGRQHRHPPRRHAGRHGQRRRPGRSVLSEPAPLADGTYSYTATATDAAGNLAHLGRAQRHPRHRRAGRARPRPRPASDTGSSGSDRVTRDTTPTSPAAPSRAPASPSAATALVATVSADGLAPVLTEPGALADGSYSYTATATDAAGNASPASAALGVTIDATPPAITAVTLPPDATYKAGDSLTLRLTFSETVHLDSLSPALDLVVGGVARTALYVSGDGSGELVFAYTVQPGDLDTDGIGLASLSLNGATLRDAAGNDASLALPALGPTGGILVDGVAPQVASVGVPADGTYGAGQVLGFTVTLDESVSLSGGASLVLLVGGTLRQAAYVSGAPGSALLFEYTVQPGDLDSDGINVMGLALDNGATLRDAAGNDASLALNGVGATAAIRVDAVPPAPPSIALDPASDTGSASNDALTNATTPTLSGTAEPGSTVTILVDGVADGTTLADGMGAWSYTLATLLTEGLRSITATATDAQNNILPPSRNSSPSTPARRPRPASSTPPATAVPPAATASPASPPRPSPAAPSRAPASPSAATRAGRHGQRRRPGRLVLSEPGALADGSYSYTATATDAAGNVSASSAALGVTLDTTPRRARPRPRPRQRQRQLQRRRHHQRHHPDLSGTAELAPASPSAATARWSPRSAPTAWAPVLSEPPARRRHLQLHRHRHRRGRQCSLTSAALSVTLDTAAPARPASPRPRLRHRHLRQRPRHPRHHPTLAGSAEPGASIAIRRDGALVATVSADGLGSVLTEPGALADGSYSYTATATDAAGNARPPPPHSASPSTPRRRPSPPSPCRPTPPTRRATASPCA
ncbi:Ig-like domain-containing protein [Pseudoroseomonas cervicalis]|uniref:Ig-like domain-containing protein n=1 Tax=Teichococcus cervicalis TaxID=204525 RepID=UPI0035EB0CC4